MVSWVKIASVHHELVLSSMRIEDFMLVVVMRIRSRKTLVNSHIFMMNFAFSITMVEATMLVGPEKLIIGRK